jgi:hypothetical protein
MTENPANQTTLGRDVFVSYASHDAAVAQKACSALEAADFQASAPECSAGRREIKAVAIYLPRVHYQP